MSTAPLPPRPAPPTSLPARLVARVAGACAACGGLGLLAALVLAVTQATGPGPGTPTPADPRLAERLMGVSVFLILPYGHLVSGHLTVDLLVRRLSPRPRRRMAAGIEALFGIVAGALAWRMAAGGVDLWRHQQTTAAVPPDMAPWWAFAVIVPALGLLTLVCLLRIAMTLRQAP